MYNYVLEDGPVYDIKGVYSLPNQKLSINGTLYRFMNKTIVVSS